MKLEIVVTHPPEAVVAALIGSINAANAPEAAATLLGDGAYPESQVAHGGATYWLERSADGGKRLVAVATDPSVFHRFAGTVETVLRAEPPWSPTDVAVHGREIYVLEWTNANQGPEAGWRPRVRKLGAHGEVTTLITISENVLVTRPR